MSADLTDKVVQLAEARQRFAIARANDDRDVSMIAEVERRFAEAMCDVAELGGVSIAYLDALMRASWGLSDSAGGGAMWPDWAEILRADPGLTG